MPDTKIDFKNLGPIRLMALDTSLFLPFGRPIAEYLRGATGKENGFCKLVQQSALEFPMEIHWKEFTSGMLDTTPLSTPGPVVEPASPNVEVGAPKSATTVKDVAPVVSDAALPLRQRTVIAPKPLTEGRGLATADAPFAFGDPTASDALFTFDNPKASETPKASDKPWAFDNPSTLDLPKEFDRKASDAPKAFDKPKTLDDPKSLDDPKASDKPWAFDNPNALERPKEFDKASNTPKAFDKSKTLADPKVLDDRKTSDKPKVSDNPNALQHPKEFDNKASDAPKAFDKAKPLGDPRAMENPKPFDDPNRAATVRERSGATKPVESKTSTPAPAAKPTVTASAAKPVAPQPLNKVATPAQKPVEASKPGAKPVEAAATPSSQAPKLVAKAAEPSVEAPKQAAKPIDAVPAKPAAPVATAKSSATIPDAPPVSKAAPPKSTPAKAAPVPVVKTAPVRPVREPEITLPAPPQPPLATTRPVQPAYDIEPPRFGGAASPSASNQPRLGSENAEGAGSSIPMAVKIGVPALILAGLAWFFVGGSTTTKQPVQQTQAIGDAGWAPAEAASDTAGVSRYRHLTLYRPSMKMSDYTFSFNGQIQQKSLGWAFRVQDTKNYYAMKIELIKPGVAVLTHFAVVEGRESSYSQKPLRIPVQPNTVYQVKLAVAGPQFTVSVQGQPIDFWTDNRIKAGSVGFLSERDEVATTSQVNFSYANRASN